MTDDADAQRHKGRFWLFWNWLSLIGGVVFAIGTVVSLFLFLIEFQDDRVSPYLSIITFACVPAVVTGGAALIVLGAFLQVLRRRRSGDLGATQIDFSQPAHARMVVGVCFVALVLATLSLYAAYGGYEFSESSDFCGTVCHQVMSPEFGAHETSAHARVHCTKCHIGPGIGHFIRAKINGLHQVKAVLTDSYHRPIATPLERLRTADEICEQCHWPAKFHGKNAWERSYFLPDEENTRVNITLLMHIGGGNDIEQAAGKDVPNLHWHAFKNHAVYYRAADAARDEIPWVKTVNSAGESVVYIDEDADKDAVKKLVAEATAVRMDCIDCHNRAAHQFVPPQRAVNRAMVSGAIDPALPFAKAKAVELLSAEYAAKPAALTAIADGFTGYYRDEYPNVWGDRRDVVERGAQVVARIYRENFFPEMKADWRAHADHLGHLFTPGCFRCHDGQHVSAGGKRIVADCNTCHDFIAESRDGEPAVLGPPREFSHPEDIGGMWQETRCAECHTGAGVDF